MVGGKKVVINHRGYFTLEENGVRTWKALGTPSREIAQKRIMEFALQAQRVQEGMGPLDSQREAAAKCVVQLVGSYEKYLAGHRTIFFESILLGQGFNTGTRSVVCCTYMPCEKVGRLGARTIGLTKRPLRPSSVIRTLILRLGYTLIAAHLRCGRKWRRCGGSFLLGKVKHNRKDKKAGFHVP
jgi:hypothetical protein